MAFRQVNYQSWQRVANFWQSTYRDGHSHAYEFLEIRLSQPRLISEIHFNVAHWPQRVSVDYWDGKKWRPWTSRTNVGDSTVCNILDSQGIPGRSRVWERQRFRPVVRRVQRFRIASRRLVWEENWWVRTHRHPRDVRGNLARYPIVIGALDIKYTATRREEIPRPKPPPGPKKPPPPPIIGKKFTYNYTEHRAEDILPDAAARRGLTAKEARKQGALFWKCEPQPVTYAVVNFYADTRNTEGAAQTVSRFFLDPLHTGPSINLYYSNDDPDATFEAHHRPIPYGLTLRHGVVTALNAERGLPLPATGGPNYLSVDGKAIDFNPSKTWWLGLQVDMHSSSTLTGARPLVDIGGNVLYLTQGQINLRNNKGEILRANVEFAAGERLWVIAGYEPATQRLFLHFRRDGGAVQTTTLPLTLTVADRLAGYVWVGNSQVALGGSLYGGFDLHSLVLKSGVLPSQVDIDAYVADSNEYVRHGDMDNRDEDASTDNSVLRWHPDFVAGGNPTGFYGGPGDYYQDLVWTPIMRDFRCAKGYMNFPATKAKFWKFEFTNLIAEPYGIIEPVIRKVKLFPRPILAPRRTPITRRPTQPTLPGNVNSGMRTMLDLRDDLRYEDSMPLFRSAAEVREFTKSEAFHTLDPDARERLSKASTAWKFMPWHLPGESPRWPDVGRHRYDVVNIRHKEKIAFFVGLKRLEPTLVNYSANDDTAQYIEPFIDLSNVESSTWTLVAGGVGFDMEDGYLSSGTTGNAVAVSKTFPSGRKLRAIQFATTQSNALQLLSDHDFNDPLHLKWTALGDATFIPDTVEVGGLGNTLGIVRGAGTNTSVPAGTGGVESVATAVGGTGRLHAAVRVFSEVPLNKPLWLQILNADNNALLVERPVTVTGTGPTEWHVGLTLGHVADVRNMKVRVVQKEATTDTWYTDDISIYEDPIFWEFSADGGGTWVPALDIRNNPHGVLVFADNGDPASNRGLKWRVTAGRPNLTIGGLVIRPWYHGLLSGIAPRVGQNAGGPSISSYDQYPPITDDPRFKVWSSPIPHDWWLSFRSLYLTSAKPLLGGQTTLMTEDFVSGVNSE